ncbi:hypothetical protein HBB16_13255 [Pseudonocardia sp. MCCB 268]|nr:hypothetical protein [Pseudonocardia cytotoxica]
MRFNPGPAARTLRQARRGYDPQQHRSGDALRRHRDRDDLQFWSTLTGDRDERITTTDLHGRVTSKTVRRVPVLPRHRSPNLPVGKVVVIRRRMAPVIRRAQMAWHRRDVHRQARASAGSSTSRRPRWWSVLALRRDERYSEAGS